MSIEEVVGDFFWMEIGRKILGFLFSNCSIEKGVSHDSFLLPLRLNTNK